MVFLHLPFYSPLILNLLKICELEKWTIIDRMVFKLESDKLLLFF